MESSSSLTEQIGEGDITSNDQSIYITRVPKSLK